MNEAVRKDWVKKVETTCAKSIKSLDAQLTALIEERVKARAALFEKGKAKAVALGAAK